MNVPPCLIGIEAGMATRYIARELVALGHEIKQIPAAYAKAFRRPQAGCFIISAENEDALGLVTKVFRMRCYPHT